MDPALTPNLSPLPAVLASVGLSITASLLAYVYFGVTLMLIAKKSHTPSAGLAWLPIGNIFLMFMIGRRPSWWFLLLFIPVVNLIVMLVTWMAMAESRGKPVWVGALAAVPVVGALVPILLAVGPPTDPEAAGAGGGCASCGTAIPAGNRFCDHCGAVAPSGGVGRSSLWPAAAGATVALMVVHGAIGAASWAYVARKNAYTPPGREAPKLPARVAGTLREFPVDTDTNAPVQPASVVMKDYEGQRQRGGSPEGGVPEGWLPPGVEPASLPARARSATSAIYCPSPGPTPEPTPDQPGDGPDYVGVSVIEPVGDPDQASDDLSRDIAAATNGRQTGIEVVNPAGEVYTGVMIGTDDMAVSVLEKQAAPVVIVVYAPSPKMVPVAERLAGNVGNGEGLHDYPGVQDTVWVLPADPPPDFVFVEMASVTPADVGLSAAELDEQVGAVESAGAGALVTQASQLLPDRFIAATYSDGSDEPWATVLCQYPSGARAWLAWSFMQYALRASGARKVSVLGVDAVFFVEEDLTMLICQKGPWLIFAGAPPGADMNAVVALADSLQI